MRIGKASVCATAVFVCAHLTALGQVSNTAAEILIPNIAENRGSIVQTPALEQAGIAVLVQQTPDCTLSLTVQSTDGQGLIYSPQLVSISGAVLESTQSQDGRSCWKQSEAEIQGAQLRLEVSGIGRKFWNKGLSVPIAWGLWTLSLVAVIALLTMRSRAATATPAAAITATEADQHWLSRVLPIVRIRKHRGLPIPFLKRDEMIALFPTELLYLRKRRNATPEAGFETEGAAKLGKSKGIHIRRRLELQSITRVEVERTTILNRVAIRFLAGGQQLKFQVLERELPNLLRAINILLPGRVVTGCPVRYHLGFIATVFLIGASTSIAFTLMGYVLGLVALFLFAGSLALAFIAHAPKPRWRIERQKRAAEDLSHRRPLRSRPLSAAVKLVAVASLLFLFTKGESLVPDEDLRSYVWLGALFAFANLVQIGNSLWQRDYSKVRGNHSRSTILYLRSFLDDRETTLNPGNFWSWILGLDPPVYQIEPYRDTPIYGFFRALVLYLSNYHPLRMFKLLFSRQRDSSEEQMARFFERYGAFVAIGRPGERFATTGATRMYVGNEEWQGVVEGLLNESQIVLLQPAATEGIWWEVERSIRMVRPERLLLCMVNYRDQQNSYESFRLRLENLLPGGQRVPGAIGCNPHITFFRFDKDWHAVEMPVVYHWRLLWLFKNRAVHFEKTLGPFLASAGVADQRGKPTAVPLAASAGGSGQAG